VVVVEQWIEEVSLMCHQCQRNDKGRVVRCKKCKRKRYCKPCLDNWYGFLLFSFCVKLVSFYAKLYLTFSFLMTYLVSFCYLIGVCEIILGEFHHLVITLNKSKSVLMSIH